MIRSTHASVTATLQPIAATGVDIVDVDGESIDCEKTADDLNCLIPVDQYSCSVLPSYAGYTQEIEFERINVARAPADVMAVAVPVTAVGREPPVKKVISDP